ncbi:MAG: ElyC/SanA/YdcF family protein [Anaerolineales bacterium]|nr:ElyC/SanA/YdcF family protein [Anaerolineales bacterium]
MFLTPHGKIYAVSKRPGKMILKLLFSLILISLLALLVARLVTGLYARARIYTAADAPASRAAIVFGAGLLRDGSATPILRDRVAAAADLYFSGKVEKILMSGDNRFVNYNEPGAMRAYALSLGVPEDAIVLDYAGRRTYDTCYRAKAIFGLSQAILVTQKFHLPRALYTCNMLGLPSIGVDADRQISRRVSVLYWNVRELLATSAALWDVHVKHPIPVLGEAEPMFP